MAENRIGEHLFFSLSGEGLEGLKQRLQVVARAGVAGVGIWQDAVRAHPITLRSAVDCENLDVGRDYYNQYKESIGQDPVDLVWAGSRMTQEKFRVVVLDVRLVSLKSLAIAVGGLHPPAGAWLECEWDLIGIAI